MGRNLHNVRVTAGLLNLCFPTAQRLVDVGAGHGVFVRMMRDIGFNFLWMDRYASNDYARGFECQAGMKYEFLTAFEVLEHLENPIADMAEWMEMSENVFVSTVLVPKEPPRPPDWWYYAQSSGQHISFYTARTLQVIADRFGRALVSDGDYHLFTRTPLSEIKFRLAMNRKTARLINLLRPRPSLIDSDFQRMTR